jgi:hypothetical protein
MELLIALHVDITKAANNMGLETPCSNGLARAEWQKNYSHTHRKIAGGVCGQVLSVEGHFITPQL